MLHERLLGSVDQWKEITATEVFTEMMKPSEMSKCKFIELDTNFLQSIATDSDRVPSLYFSRYWPVRKGFWMRLRMIYWLLLRFQRVREKCLDFGGGGGVFLPTLSGLFKSVICIDLENKEAQKTIQEYGLDNVRLIQGDITKGQISDAPFDAIVAADVLEHFKDLSSPIDALKRWLGSDGILYTSLPTENYIYTGLRKVFGVTKPWDHYHTGYEVEMCLESHGFRKVESISVPLYFKAFPLFLISVWRIDR